MFSQKEILHFGFNMFALSSIGTAAHQFLSTRKGTGADQTPEDRLPESTSSYHFLAFFVAAGLFSSLGSHLVSTLIRVPRLVKLLRMPASPSTAAAIEALPPILPSLGASGAIYSALTLTALAYPDANVSPIFLPILSIPIGAGVGGMVALDMIGILRGWG